MARTLLVFGARNLGAAIAERFALAGWSVAAVARSKETVEAFEQRIPDGLGLALDATVPANVDEAAARTRERFRSLDLVVNAVSPGLRPGGSTFGGGPIADAIQDDYEHYAAGVLQEAFAVIRGGARALRESGGGTLVQITGGSSRRGIPGRGMWAAGAFATRALMQSASLELRDEGIHAALLIVDATIRSPKTEPYIEDAPEDGLATMDDVARAVEYLEAQPPTAWTHELQVTPRADRWVP